MNKNQRAKDTFFLFVGLRYTEQNFKVRRSEKELIKIGRQPKSYKITETSKALLLPMSHAAIYSYI